MLELTFYDNQLSKLDAELAKLRQEKDDVIAKRNVALNTALNEAFKSWNISKECYLAVFTTDLVSSWTLLSCLHVRDIEEDKLKMDAIVTDYRKDYDDYSVKVNKCPVLFDNMLKLSKDHHIYIIDRSTYMLLQHYMCNLCITRETFQEYEDSISSTCLHRIS